MRTSHFKWEIDELWKSRNINISQATDNFESNIRIMNQPLSQNFRERHGNNSSDIAPSRTNLVSFPVSEPIYTDSSLESVSER
jgi:hypothetical protein